MSFKTKKSLGQNFLINPHILDKIISAAEISKEDTVIEVGPGTGLLTKKLSEKAGRVIGVEKDHRLIEPLKEAFKNSPNVEIIEGDVLELNTQGQWQGRSLPSEYKIVANIPYYITSNFIRTVSEEWPQPELMVLTIQKEVAQRIIAKPPHMNLLALSVQYYYEPKIIGYISKNNFRPVPKIDSAIIKLNPKTRVGDTNIISLFNLMHIGFSEKRKQLIPLLAKGLKTEKDRLTELFKKTGLNPTVRAENLSLEQWQQLKNNLPD